MSEHDHGSSSQAEEPQEIAGTERYDALLIELRSAYAEMDARAPAPTLRVAAHA